MTLCCWGIAQNCADFPTLFYNNSLEGSGAMRYPVQPCISAVYQWCAVNPGSVRTGKCVGGFVTIHTFHKMENKSYENLGACHFSVSLAGSQRA